MRMKPFRLIALAVVMLAAMTACSANFEASEITKLSLEDADKTLASFMTEIDVSYGDPPADLDSSDIYVEEMPDIDTRFPFAVSGEGQVNLEIWGSTERTGQGNDGWLNRVTEQFNQRGIKLANGQTVSVSLRSIDSGTQLDYLILTDNRPDAWTVSNMLWQEMAVSRGIPSEVVLERTVGNEAGILMEKTVYDEFVAKYGSFDLLTLVEDVMSGGNVLGFTNPYTSSTALNMLAQILMVMDEDNPLSAEAAAKFMEFQQFAPPPAYTTAQMRESAKKGFINAMTMESQAYINEPTLSDYVFTPFGVRHDNPVFTFADISGERREALDLWCEYIMSEESQRLANNMGFNRHDDYPGMQSLSGSDLYSAQALWKQNKSGGKPTVAVFVADVSGSMAGGRIAALKDSLLNSMQYINEENHIGFVSYSDDVRVELPLAQFEGIHRAKFQGAVKNLSVGGGTYMYSGVLAALDMIRAYRDTVGEANYMIFMLTDGETTGGVKENVCAQLVASYGVPVHTIGYGDEIGDEPLGRLASYAEGFSIKVSTDDVIYNMKNMFNAQM